MANPHKPEKKPPTSDELLDNIDEAEDDRVAAEEASDIDEADAAVVTDAREERVP